MKSISSKNYVQIPILKTAGKRTLLIEDISNLLTENGYDIVIDGGVLTISKPNNKKDFDGQKEKETTELVGKTKIVKKGKKRGNKK